MGKTGRPASYNTREIKEIIDQYVRYTDGRVLLNASKIADFAQKELHLTNFRYYVINRNPETKQYLEELNQKIKGAAVGEVSSPTAVFKNIDIEAYMNMSPERLRQALANVNIQMEGLSDKYAEIIRENMALRCQVADQKKMDEELSSSLSQTIMKQKEEIAVLKERYDALVREHKELQTSVHMAWDEEAEKVLMKTNTFVDNGTPLDENVTITDVNQNVISLTDIWKQRERDGGNKSKSKSTVRAKFLKDLEDLN